jgi:hypothetical protein
LHGPDADLRAIDLLLGTRTDRLYWRELVKRASLGWARQREWFGRQTRQQ